MDMLISLPYFFSMLRSLLLQVPYLEDPNTNEAYFESTAIIKYINDRYAK